MARLHILAGLCVLAVALSPDPAKADSITGFDISPEGPAVLKHGAQVTVTFGYRVTSPRGARIFVRPMHDGQLAPNYAASGSRVFERGDGRARAQFTIRMGETDIDALRFQIVDAATERVVSEHFERVQFRFNADPMAPCAAAPSCEANAITGRRLLPDGSLEVSYADGVKKIHHPGGATTTINPDGTMMMSSPITLAPTPPPGDSSAPDPTWMSEMNDWLDTISASMLDDIERLAGDPDSFANYQALEAAETATDYERLDMRHRFLSLLSR